MQETTPAYSARPDEWTGFLNDVTEFGRRWPNAAGRLRDELLRVDGFKPQANVDLNSGGYPNALVWLKPSKDGVRAFMMALRNAVGTSRLPRSPTPFLEYEYWVRWGRPFDLSGLPAEELPAQFAGGAT